MLQVDLLIVLQVGRSGEGIERRRSDGKWKQGRNVNGKWKEYVVGMKMFQRNEEKRWDKRKIEGQRLKMGDGG